MMMNDDAFRLCRGDGNCHHRCWEQIWKNLVQLMSFLVGT